MSKEMRRERNRITARESRDRKAAYIVQLEADVQRLNDRVAQLEYDLGNLTVNHNPFTCMEDMPLLLSPDQMGFFDAV